MRRPRPATVARVTAAAASGALLAFSRPPFDVGPLACVALVPLFLAWRGRGPRAAAGLAFVGGAVYYAVLCSWIWYFGAIAIVPFVAAVAAYWAAAGALLAWLRRARVTNPWVTAAIWVCAEAAVARWPFGGFSWGEVGYSFHQIAPARALASVGGVPLVTFLAVALNAFVADLVSERRTIGAYVRAQLGIATIAAVTVGATLARAEPRVVKDLHVALVQGNDLNRDLTDAEVAARYLPASHFRLASDITRPVDLIVFPESSMDADPRSDLYIHDTLAGFARRDHAWVLANATVPAPHSTTRVSNLDVLFSPSGRVEGTYAKRHLVPYGEWVPFGSTLRHVVGELSRIPRDYKPGDTRGLFAVAGVKIATVICFESAFGYQVRPLVHAGAQVIVLSTNNRSYRRSANSEQHVAIGQMRAAETGRPVVQSAISGITAVIDADGVVHDRTDLFQRAVVQTTVAATSGETPYLRYGEWLTQLSLAMGTAAIAVAAVRQRRKSSLDSGPDPGPAPMADERESTATI